ncbi:MAG: hypothetical protein AB4050_10725 [Synechococcus sp.]
MKVSGVAAIHCAHLAGKLVVAPTMQWICRSQIGKGSASRNCLFCLCLEAIGDRKCLVTIQGRNAET